MQYTCTTGYGYQRFVTASSTLHSFAPLLSRQALTEILAECLASVQQNERRKMAMFVQSAEQCAEKSRNGKNDTDALMWACICFKECRQALSGLIPGAIEANEVELREQQVQNEIITKRVADHPDYLTYKPYRW